MCALSPWAIVAVILMLASDRPSNSIAWLAGWTLSTFAVGLIVVFFFSGDDFSSGSSATRAASIIQVALGVLLLLAARRFWSRRPARTGKAPEEPGWMKKIGQMKPLWAFLIGAFWINTALVVAAAVDMLKANISDSSRSPSFAVFSLVTASVQAAMILYADLMPKRATVGLKRIREWIARNQEAALAVICVVLAVWLASKGIRGLGA